MKRIPRVSLAARTFLLILVVIAVAEYATFSLLDRNRNSSHMRRIVSQIAGQVRLLQTVLPGLDGDARQRLEAADVGEPDLRLRPDGDSVPTHQPDFGFGQRLSEELEQVIGGAVTVRHTGQGRRGDLWIGFKVGNERWWLVLPPPRFEPEGLPRDLWLWLAATLTALVLITGFFVRGIVGPLARLGEAVAATGDGRARTVTLEGPKEVRQLAARHNTMVVQLAEADAERREMLAGLTHDLRAPLARLRVRLALLDSDADRAGLMRDAEDMERIVTQCLAFLRSEEVGIEPVPPLLIADAVSDEVARQRELERPIEMTVSDAAAACQVAIARGNLQRLLDNLIDNALQYGAPPVEVALYVDHPGTLTLRVRDHGVGIVPGERAHALDAFVQIDPARATRGSCGLGLAIVRRIVVASGGDVSLAEAPGGGLDVVLTLPCTD